tara:strand:- start:1559 stop:1816 length:258 start_codon:yes stop_codon:yes gene_type:complete
MKIFIYKFLISVIGVFILYQLTIGLTIKKAEKTIFELSSKENIESIKKKIREEMKNGIQKEKILNEEDAVLLKKFYSKIKKELNE